LQEKGEHRKANRTEGEIAWRERDLARYLKGIAEHDATKSRNVQPKVHKIAEKDSSDTESEVMQFMSDPVEYKYVKFTENVILSVVAQLGGRLQRPGRPRSEKTLSGLVEGKEIEV
jgi:hypothetical protein